MVDRSSQVRCRLILHATNLFAAGKGASSSPCCSFAGLVGVVVAVWCLVEIATAEETKRGAVDHSRLRSSTTAEKMFLKPSEHDSAGSAGCTVLCTTHRHTTSTSLSSSTIDEQQASHRRGSMDPEDGSLTAGVTPTPSMGIPLSPVSGTASPERTSALAKFEADRVRDCGYVRLTGVDCLTFHSVVASQHIAPFSTSMRTTNVKHVRPSLKAVLYFTEGTRASSTNCLRSPIIFLPDPMTRASPWALTTLVLSFNKPANDF